VETRGFALGLLPRAAKVPCLDVSGCTEEGVSGAKLDLLHCFSPGLGIQPASKQQKQLFLSAKFKCWVQVML